MIKLGDDGTMDTVFFCDQCNEEIRYTYDASSYEDIPSDEDAYDAFVDWAILDAEDGHDCTVVKFVNVPGTSLDYSLKVTR